jgi:hypothetical protein
MMISKRAQGLIQLLDGTRTFEKCNFPFMVIKTNNFAQYLVHTAWHLVQCCKHAASWPTVALASTALLGTCVQGM